ncbi:MAG TPA: ATP-binding protein, partial [Methylocella sp.]|nr:ATP-binding protein [Methylocella sp.]
MVEAGAWVKDRAGTKILPHKFQHGTSIRITGLKDRWTSEMFRELAGELWFLQPPRIVAADIDVASRFNIELKGVSESDLEQYESQTKAALGNWIARIRGTVENGRASREAKIRLEFSDGEKHTATYSLPNGALDQARFDVLIFKLSGRQAGGISVEDARKYFKRFGGVHIYDSGFRLPYYGGGEHDWLSLEVAHSHRLIQSQILPEALRPEGGTLQDLPTLARVFGVVRVSTSHESQTADAKTPPSRLLTVQVTRDKLIDNLAYADLEYFVRWAFDFYSYHSTARRTRAAAETISSFVDAIDTRLETVRLQAMALKSKVPAKLVEPLEQALDRFEEAQEKRRIEADAERVLLGALATAGMGSVALQHELAKELISLTEQIKALDAQLVGEEREETKEAVRSLKKWVKTASQTRLMFAPFFHVEDRDRPKRLRVGRTLKRLASNLAPLLRGTEVEIDDIDDNLQLPKGTFAGWNAVFQNIFVNAVNAMLETPQKRIRCRAQSDSKGRVRLIVEDTGVGLDIDSSEELFRPFARKLELSEERQALGFGGMGIGLTIVRMVCRTYGCEIHFI